jgi:glutathione synthase/RimK-type ligase-like ATP-grasp enzyme
MDTTIQNPAPVQQAQSPAASVAVIVERRYLTHAQPAGLIRALKRMGHSVLVVDAESNALEASDSAWTQGIDVALARGRSWGVLCLLDWLERCGVPVINQRRAIAAVHNKAEMSVALAEAGLPTPRTWLGPLDHLAVRIPDGDYPLIVKPLFGDNCRGLELVAGPAQLRGLHWPEGMVIAQKFFAGLAFDLKLYAIGQQVWAVRKLSPLKKQFLPSEKTPPPQLVEVSTELRNLARRCGQVFNLDLFGVDCIETEQGPLVIEVNEFPNYSAVPGADEKLSDFVLAYVKQEKAI